MKRAVLSLAALAMCPAFAQPPLVYNRAVVNAASFMPQGLPGGGIARGSIFTIFGARFGPGSPAQATAFPLQTTLSNVSVTLTQGATTVNAIPVFVSGRQVNAIMPSYAPRGMASLRVSYFNARSNPVPVRIVDSAFGIFAATGAGVGPGILQNFIAPDNQPINSPTVTAQPGQTMILWGTGLGAVANDAVAPSAGNLPTKVEVFVGGQQATVAYSGRTPCCSGTDQIVFTVPNNAPLGCWVPVLVRTEGTTVSNAVTIAVQNDPNACSDPAQYPINSGLVKGARIGGFVAIRANTREDIGVFAPVDVAADYHASGAFQLSSTAFPYNPLLSLPPPGTCTQITSVGDLLSGDMLIPGTLPSGPQLSMGPLFSLSGPKGQRTLTEFLTGSRVGYLGGAAPGLSQNSLFLDPGSYTLIGTGGTDVGPFSANFVIPPPLAWTNRDRLQAVPRNQPLTLTWSGGNGQSILIAGFDVDLPSNASAGFACVAPAGASSFAVPSIFLANFASTRANYLQSKSVLYLISLPSLSSSQFAVNGLDFAAAAGINILGKTVFFK